VCVCVCVCGVCVCEREREKMWNFVVFQTVVQSVPGGFKRRRNYPVISLDGVT
jgi:hypothetical protein